MNVSILKCKFEYFSYYNPTHKTKVSYFITVQMKCYINPWIVMLS